MSFLSKIGRAFRPLDTSEAEAAIAAALQSQRDVAVRARALRMDISCGDPQDAIRRLTGQLRSSAAFWLHHFFDDVAAEPIPQDQQALLEKL